MSRHPFKTGTSTLIALSILASAAAPIITTSPAAAQSIFKNRGSQPLGITIQYGTTLPLIYNSSQKLVVPANQASPVPLTLQVAGNVRARSGALLIPMGTEVVGELQSVNGGARFVAREIVFSGNRRQAINASSNIIAQTQESQGGINTGRVLTNAAIGAAAAAGISGITGNRKIEAGEVLIGAGAGAASGVLLGSNKTNAVVLNPSAPVSVILNAPLALR
ncbi:hypothetical protein Cri9333_3636 [Crinalium epipsammum PCC 9333]|uniref:Uncharacterized protein n=1 Tax=Crinalium epipsammum PCC 9333 TaxID=1173022 RepID=K9W3T1_9CYAN|nr:hypothetical protein [Crinalium epipsammum]AFZ14454.1 hypothetical protein Cri9333_3636 [Crinalium epipsammum PCC 9333]